MFELLGVDRRPSFRLMVAGHNEMCSRSESQKTRKLRASTQPAPTGLNNAEEETSNRLECLGVELS